MRLPEPSVPGMSCEHCLAAVTDAVSAIRGVAVVEEAGYEVVA